MSGGSRKPRIGALGTGWIGRDRLRAVAETGLCEIVAICDPCEDAATETLASHPLAERLDDLQAMLGANLDGVMIATPSARHAAEALQCLERGVAVFCQKPLGRDAEEVRRVLDAARRADRLLGVDHSYRRARAFEAAAENVRSGALGDVHAAELVFHNVYGPGKPWFLDRAQSGGGCLIDLGSHLVDMLFHVLGRREVVQIAAHLSAAGQPLTPETEAVEDFALAQIVLQGAVAAQLACSWHSNLGQDAVIRATFHGTKASVTAENVGGSFYDFRAEQFDSTRRDLLFEGTDDWGGRMAVDWARTLAAGAGYDTGAEDFARSARLLDGLYGCHMSASTTGLPAGDARPAALAR